MPNQPVGGLAVDGAELPLAVDDGGGVGFRFGIVGMGGGRFQVKPGRGRGCIGARPVNGEMQARPAAAAIGGRSGEYRGARGGPE